MPKNQLFKAETQHSSLLLAGNLGGVPDIDPLKPATTPMDFSRLGAAIPSALPWGFRSGLG